MNVKDAAVYRVCPGAADCWEVFQEPSSQPMASFGQKAAAIHYAMSLARGREAWHMLLPGGVGHPSDALGSRRRRHN